MAESQFLHVIRVWAALAWADGKIADDEASALHRLIGAAELTDEERDEANGYLATKLELDTAALNGLSLDARKGIYRAACRMALVDGEFVADERTFLGKLAEALSISDDDVVELERSVPGMK